MILISCGVYFKNIFENKYNNLFLELSLAFSLHNIWTNTNSLHVFEEPILIYVNA